MTAQYDTSNGLALSERVARRQAVLDAVSLLQAARTRCADRLASVGDAPGVELFAVGVGAPNQMMAWARTWSHVRSTQATGYLARVEASLPTNRRVLSDGLDMESIWDDGLLESSARELLVAEDHPCYRLSAVPIEMKIVDHRAVVLVGPIVDGEPSVMVARRPEVLAAAGAYWRAVRRVSHLATDDTSPPVTVTRRQRQIVALLAQDHCDDAIAESLGVSVRTVRADIAAIMRTLGVRSRFAAGMKCRDLAEPV